MTVNSVTYTDPTHLTINISTVGSLAGSKDITITNPDGQQLTGSNIFTVDAPLPIQLASFTGRFVGASSIRLDWHTISEINNYGFEIQKTLHESGDFQSIAGVFIPGHGTTTIPQYYGFVDSIVPSRAVYYRLKQIDLDGTINFSDPILVSITTDVAQTQLPKEFSLGQNYPNPFNPTTIINYGLPVASNVSLEVFNTLGQRVAQLVDGREEAGYYVATLDASRLSSGLYFYTIKAGEFIASRKLMLLK